MQSEQKPKQLQMIWPENRLNSPPTFSVSQEYVLRTFQAGNEEGYLRLMHLAGFTYWTLEHVQNSLSSAIPGGIFFVVHRTTNLLVATTSAQHGSYYKGEIGWVAADPGHHGKGLGYAVCAAALGRLIQAGYREIFLKTDDFRLPAIKIYFKMGFVPRLTGPEMIPRWQTVCHNLGMPIPQGAST